jgi:ADP-ribose pyrophosphatase
MAHEYEVESSEEVYEGAIIAVRRDQVAMPGGKSASRDVVVHPGAVGVVAYDESGRILLLHQYRHPVRQRLWELPAGLLDVEGEAASKAAQRELAEEAGIAAARWDTLVDTFTSPGMSDEAIRVYLARDLRELEEQHERVDEEAELEPHWVALGEAVARVMRGDITNAMAVAGILAAAVAERDGFAGLRPASAPWDARPAHAG